MLHHFPTRRALIQATYADVLKHEADLVREFARNLEPETDRLRALTEFIWERYQTGVFQISMDYISEARVDAEELRYVSEESQRFNDALNDVWHVELAAFGCDSGTRQDLINEFMCLIRGMAFQSQWRKDSKYFQKMLRDWRSRAHSILIPKIPSK